MTTQTSWLTRSGAARSVAASWMPPRRRLWAGVVVAGMGPVLLAMALLPARDHVDGAVVGLVMILPTVVGAAVGGPLAAAVAVVVGSTTHNVLFTRPYLTVRVADTTDVVGLVAHVVVGVAVAVVVAREQRAAALATRREEEAARLRVLGEIDRVRTALLGAVSHDLRTPLAAIAAAGSDLQATDVEFSEHQRAILAGTIVDQAQRLDRTVAKLLDAGRLQAGSMTVAAEAVEAQDLIAEAIAALPAPERPRLRVWVAPRTRPLFVDPVLVVAALRNVLENAVRYSPAGSTVEVTAEGAGTGVVVAVRDHGPGLDDDRAQEMFEAFHGSRAAGGVGLGLAICRGFVEAHGGQVRHHDPDDGIGAVFELVLPSAQEPAE